MAIATTPPFQLDGRVPLGGRPSADRLDHLRGSLLALGARQLERDGARLHRGRPPVARGLHRVRAHRRRCGTTRLFFWGEDVVADNLSPYIDAAPLEEQKYFLTTQQVDEARHAVFFKRFMHEVCGHRRRLDGERPAARSSPSSPPAFARSSTASTRWPTNCAPTARRPQLAAAVTLYHVVIEAALAQPGQHFICSYLEAAQRAAGVPPGDGRTSPPTSSATSASA